ncbi:hypothetical protein HEP_00496400, partial [Hepatocystis sp. ex Piliocolobus tephrosceles]
HNVKFFLQGHVKLFTQVMNSTQAVEKNILEKILDSKDNRIFTGIYQGVLQRYNEVITYGNTININKNRIFSEVFEGISMYNDDNHMTHKFDFNEHNIYPKIKVQTTKNNHHEYERSYAKKIAEWQKNDNPMLFSTDNLSFAINNHQKVKNSQHIAPSIDESDLDYLNDIIKNVIKSRNNENYIKIKDVCNLHNYDEDDYLKTKKSFIRPNTKLNSETTNDNIEMYEINAPILRYNKDESEIEHINIKKPMRKHFINNTHDAHVNLDDLNFYKNLTINKKQVLTLLNRRKRRNLFKRACHKVKKHISVKWAAEYLLRAILLTIATPFLCICAIYMILKLTYIGAKDPIGNLIYIYLYINRKKCLFKNYLFLFLK